MVQMVEINIDKLADLDNTINKIASKSAVFKGGKLIDEINSLANKAQKQIGDLF